MDIADHQHVIAELESLLAQASEQLQRFEASGRNATMKAGYLELHALQARILDQRQQSTRVYWPGSIPRWQQGRSCPGYGTDHADSPIP